ncbi:MAG TPA: hypothetical protein VMU33_07340 [Burkholderiaceae bacterium]|nr:hypothetical protein [Burkholderiaceae bacterium]
MATTLVDAILVAIVAEAIALVAYRRMSGAGLATAPLLCSLASGAGLLGALRVALSDGGRLGPALLALLAFALMAHLAELALRWAPPRDRPPATSRHARSQPGAFRWWRRRGARPRAPEPSPPTP